MNRPHWGLNVRFVPRAKGQTDLSPQLLFGRAQTLNRQVTHVEPSPHLDNKNRPNKTAQNYALNKPHTALTRKGFSRTLRAEGNRLTDKIRFKRTKFSSIFNRTVTTVLPSSLSRVTTLAVLPATPMSSVHVEGRSTTSNHRDHDGDLGPKTTNDGLKMG